MEEVTLIKLTTSRIPAYDSVRPVLLCRAKLSLLARSEDGEELDSQTRRRLSSGQGAQRGLPQLPPRRLAIYESSHDRAA